MKKMKYAVPGFLLWCCLGCLEIEVSRTVDREGNCKSTYIVRTTNKEALDSILEVVPGRCRGISFSEPLSRILEKTVEVSFSGKFNYQSDHQVKYLRSTVRIQRKEDGSLLYEESLINVLLLNLQQAPEGEQREFWRSLVETEKKRTENLTAVWTVHLPFPAYETNATEVKGNTCIWRFTGRELFAERDGGRLVLRAVSLPVAITVARIERAERKPVVLKLAPEPEPITKPEQPGVVKAEMKKPVLPKPAETKPARRAPEPSVPAETLEVKPVPPPALATVSPTPAPEEVRAEFKPKEPPPEPSLPISEKPIEAKLVALVPGASPAGAAPVRPPAKPEPPVVDYTEPRVVPSLPAPAPRGVTAEPEIADTARYSVKPEPAEPGFPVPAEKPVGRVVAAAPEVTPAHAEPTRAPEKPPAPGAQPEKVAGKPAVIKPSVEERVAIAKPAEKAQPARKPAEPELPATGAGREGKVVVEVPAVRPAEAGPVGVREKPPAPGAQPEKVAEKAAVVKPSVEERVAVAKPAEKAQPARKPAEPELPATGAGREGKVVVKVPTIRPAEAGPVGVPEKPPAPGAQPEKVAEKAPAGKAPGVQQPAEAKPAPAERVIPGLKAPVPKPVIVAQAEETPVELPEVPRALFEETMTLLEKLRSFDPAKREEAERKFRMEGYGKFVNALVAILLDRNVEGRTRAAAAEVLGRSEDPTAIEPLLRVARTAEPIVRKEAILGLKKFPQAKERAVEVFRQALKEKHIEVVISAITALSSLGDRDSAPLLARLLKSDSDEVRFASASALGKLGNPSVVPQLIETLKKDEFYAVRRASASSLGELKSKLALKPLAEALSDSTIQTTVAEALKKISGRDFGMNKEEWLQWIETLGPIAVAPPKPETVTPEEREVEVKVEEKEGEAEAPPPPPFEEKVRPEVREFFRSGLQAFQEKRYDKAIEEFQKALELKPNLEEALKLLEEAGYRNFMLMLASEKSEIRETARRILEIGKRAEKRRITDPKKIASLVQKLDKDLRARMLAEEELMKAGKYAVPALVAQFADEVHRRRKIWSVIVLQRLGKKVTLGLAETLEARNPRIKQLACYCLKEIGDPLALPALLRLAQNPEEHPTVRKSAQEALSALKFTEKRAAEELYVELAERFFRRDESLRRRLGTEDLLLWRWDSKNERLTYLDLPPDVYYYAMAEDLATDALEVSPQYERAEPLRICSRYAQYRAISELLSSGINLPEEQESALRALQAELSDVDLVALQAGRKFLYAALDRALEAGLPDVALSILDVLEQLAQPEDLTPPPTVRKLEKVKRPGSFLARLFGRKKKEPAPRYDFGTWKMSPSTRAVRPTPPPKPTQPPAAPRKTVARAKLEEAIPQPSPSIPFDASPLIRALDSPYRSVRYAAARVLVKVSHNRPFEGMEKAVAVLTRALTESPTRLILLIDNNVQSRNQLVALLNEKSHAVLTASSGREGIERAFSFPPKDLVIISDTISDREPKELLADLREIYKNTPTQILVITEKEQIEGADDILPRPIDREYALSRIEKALRINPPPTKELMDRWALEALDAVLAINGKECVLDTSQIVNALIRSARIHRDIEGFQLKVVQALKALGRREALDYLLRLFKQEGITRELKLNVIEAIGTCALPELPEECHQVLFDGLRSEDPEIRRACARILGRSKR